MIGGSALGIYYLILTFLLLGYRAPTISAICRISRHMGKDQAWDTDLQHASQRLARAVSDTHRTTGPSRQRPSARESGVRQKPYCLSLDRRVYQGNPGCDRMIDIVIID